MTLLDDRLQDFVSLDSPVASVYLRGAGVAEDADHRFDIRWKNARRSLVDLGTPDTVVGQLDAAVDTASTGGMVSIALFATEAMPVVTEPVDDELHDDLVAFDALPRLVPLIHARQRSLPHVMVMTDRTGADIVAIADGEHRDDATVEGETHHIHRGRFGGWSQRRIQQRVEDRWEANAAHVADRLAEMARDTGARVITVSGDVRACQLLRDRLDDDLAAITTILDVGSDAEVADATVRLVSDAVARETREVLAAARQPSAATGVGPVLSALTAGRVETLLVVDDRDDDRRAWYSADACSQHRAYEDMSEGRLIDVAVRAALLGGADIRVVPDTVIDENLGAVLRW